MVRALQPDEARPFHDHLKELRSRLLWWLVYATIFSCLAFYYRGLIQAIVIRPLNKELYYTAPAGGVDFLVRTVLTFGLIPSLPVFIYQLLRFLEPALPPSVRRGMVTITVGSIVLTLIGVFFAYKVSLPIVLSFFNDFTTDKVQALISTNEYLSFVTNYVIMVAAFFQLPLVMLLINKVVPINVRKLNRYQLHTIIGLFFLAGLITPDPVSQLITVTPMVILFEAAVIGIWLTNRQKSTTAKKPSELLIEADRFYAADRFDQALTLAHRLRRQLPSSAEVVNLIAKINIKTNHFAAAEAASRQAVRQDPNVPAYHANLGISLLGQKKYAAAAVAFQAALKLKPASDKYQKLYQMAVKGEADK